MTTLNEQPSTNTEHYWASPADIASQLDAVPHSGHWRARCPAHGGDNPQSLRIAQGTDKYGHPCTLLKCFAHDCDIRDICAALGIALQNLFCIHPKYAKKTQYAPRAKGPGIARLATLDAPSPDDLAESMLCEMIPDDPLFILECLPARKALYRLAQEPERQARLFAALKRASITIAPFWRQLTGECQGGKV